MRRLLSLAMIAAVLVVIPAGSAVAHGSVDQSFEGPVNCGSGLFPGKQVAQTFTPAADNLVGVDLHINGFADLVVAIHDGGPDGPVLGSVSQTIAQGPQGWIHFDLPSAVALTPGNTYAIRVTATDNPGWQCAQPDGYAGGSGWRCQPDCIEFDRDYLFRTYFDIGDSDGDGVLDDDDLCEDTVLPEDQPPRLKKNRYYTNAEGEFVDVNGKDSGISVVDTYGCSGEQIIETAGLGRGHSRFGISRSALLDWIDANSNG